MRYQCIWPSRSVAVEMFSGSSIVNVSFSAVFAMLNGFCSCRSIDRGRWSLVYFVGLVGERCAMLCAIRMCWATIRSGYGLERNT